MGEVFKLNHCYNVDCVPAMELFPDNLEEERFAEHTSQTSLFHMERGETKNEN